MYRLQALHLMQSLESAGAVPVRALRLCAERTDRESGRGRRRTSVFQAAAGEMSQSGLIVAVPEAEPLVQDLRAQYDPAALVGVPAHITILTPLMPRELLTDAVLRSIRRALAKQKPFRFQLRRVSRFPLTTYLVPEPAEPFVEMTTVVAREFPEFPPYGGRFDQIIPHLTVADQSDAFASIAERELAARLKQTRAITSTCRTVELLENSENGYWKPYASFTLGEGAYGTSADG
jgi:2'-5' RNA ligase